MRMHAPEHTIVSVSVCELLCRNNPAYRRVSSARHEGENENSALWSVVSSSFGQMKLTRFSPHASLQVGRLGVSAVSGTP